MKKKKISKSVLIINYHSTYVFYKSFIIFNTYKIILYRIQCCSRHADLNQLASTVQEMKNKLSYLKKTASDVNKIRTVGMCIELFIDLLFRKPNSQKCFFWLFSEFGCLKTFSKNSFGNLNCYTVR